MANIAALIAGFYKREKEDIGEADDPILWTITYKNKPKYEMWVFLVDNGTVFEAGSSKPCGVDMMQGNFLSKKNAALAKALQEVVPF